jgi:S-adenosylmethionine hydrolase
MSFRRAGRGWKIRGAVMPVCTTHIWLPVIAMCAVLCGGQGAVDMALFAQAEEPFLPSCAQNLPRAKRGTMRRIRGGLMRLKIKSLAAALFAVALACTAVAQQSAHTRVIGFMTDFDVKDDAVGICKAVMEGIAPGVRVIDITHLSEPYNIAMGARFLAGSAPYFPSDAVFVVVIDPGVGSTRKAIIAKSRVGQYFVLPDNGLLTLIQDREGIAEAHQITNPAWMIGSGISSTFHGRDIFSPAGAHVARGEDFRQAGPALDVASLVRLDLKNAIIDEKGLHGQVIGTDGPFGNLVLNIPAETFVRLGYRLGDRVPVTLDHSSYLLPFVRTFSDVPVGKDLFYIDSRGRLGLATNQGNFSERHKTGEGAELTIPPKSATPKQ